MHYLCGSATTVIKTCSMIKKFLQNTKVFNLKWLHNATESWLARHIRDCSHCSIQFHVWQNQNGLQKYQRSNLFCFMPKRIIKWIEDFNNVIKELCMISSWNKSSNQQLHNNASLKPNKKQLKKKEIGKTIGFRESYLYDRAGINLQKSSVI